MGPYRKLQAENNLAKKLSSIADGNVESKNINRQNIINQINKDIFNLAQSGVFYLERFIPQENRDNIYNKVLNDKEYFLNYFTNKGNNCQAYESNIIAKNFFIKNMKREINKIVDILIGEFEKTALSGNKEKSYNHTQYEYKSFFEYKKEITDILNLHGITIKYKNRYNPFVEPKIIFSWK